MAEEKAHSELFRSLSQELLSAGRSVRFKAIGTSMGSTIRDGEVVHVDPVEPERLRKRDIVLFADGDVIRVHRIVALDRAEGMFLTRGDAMEGADAPITAERILGRVVAKERVVDGAARIVPLCGVRSELIYRAMQSRGVVSRRIRNSSFLTGARTVMQKAFLRTAGLFLVLSLLFGGKASGQIAIADTSSGNARISTTVRTVTVAHNSAGTNRLLVVGVSINLQPNPNTTVSGVTYNGVNLTRAVVDTDGTSRRAEIWYLVAPPTGTNLNVVATLTGMNATQQGVVVGAITFTGTDQSAMPFRDMGSAHGTASPTGATVDSAVGDVVVDALAMGRNRTPTAGAGQTQRWNANSGGTTNTDILGFGSTEAGASGTVSMTETLNGTTNWSQVAVSIMPYPLQAGDMIGVTPAVYFNQTTAAGTNQLLVVGVSMNIAGNAGATVTGITYNGVALTRAGAHNDAANSRRAEIWYLVNPTVGTSLPGIVSLNLPGGTGTIGVRVGSTVLTGIDPNSPVRSVVWADGAAQGLSSLNVSSAFGDTVVDTLAASGNVTGTVGPTQVQQWAGVSAGTTVDPDVYGLGSTRAGAPSVPMTEVFSAASNWSQMGVSFRPYSADLSVTSVATSTAFPAPLSYRITVKNDGPSTANAVTLTDRVASGLTGVTASASPGSCNTSALPTITCNLGNIASGSSAVITITGTPGATGGYPNTATVPTNLTPTDYNGNNNSGMAVAFSQMATCSSTVPPAASQPLTATINTYFPPSAISTVVAAGSTSVTLGASRGASSGISAGDELMFIQMQDAAINTTNTSTYGDGVSGSGSTNLNNSGVYEYVRATNSVPASGGTLTFAGSGPNDGLLYTYTNAAGTATQGQRRFQVIRVPQYSSATLGAGLTAAAWNGSTGGVFALDVAGTLTLGGGSVNVDWLGFRAGAAMQLNGSATATNSDFRSPAPAAYTGALTGGANAPKGEGIAGTPLWVESNGTYLNTGSSYPSGTAGTDGSMGRGAPGNAGGGGTDGNTAANDENSGGGGGGNGGVGGSGGNAWSANLSVGGYGGAAFPASTVRAVMGGGGGAGTRNNTDGNTVASSGGAGGGIVMIRAGSLVGTATISANGHWGEDLTTQDAGGGGGAGGSVIVLSQSGGESGLTISANGGKGGDAWQGHTSTTILTDRHGPGGGGGGGVVLLSGPAANVSIAGGANGITTAGLYPFGATKGNDGVVSTTESLSATPGNQSPTCFPDMEIVKTHSGDFPRGGSGIYTLNVSNVSVGPVPYADSVGQVTVTDSVPAGLTLTGASGSGWTCNVVPPSLTCARSETLAPGASYPPLMVSVAVPTFGPSSVTNSATVSGGGELNTANDVSLDPTNIVATSTMLIAMTAPPEVTRYSYFDYTITVTNSSGAPQNGVTVTDTLPGGVTYYSVSTSQGTCSQSSGTVSCSLGTVAANGAATITIRVQAGEPAQVENTAVVNPSGNTATAPTIITYGPTAVNLESFTATASSDGVLLRWKTGQEFNNLGFNLYREQNGERTRITPSMIAGSALTLRGGRPQHAGKTYAWIDHGATASGATYWLEDVDLNGTRTINGPARVEQAQESSSQPVSTRLMAQSRVRSTTVAEWNDAAAASSAAIPWRDTSVSHILQSFPIFSGKLTDRRNVQFALAGRAAVKIFVDHEGWYKVTQPELVAAGLSPYVDPRSLQLYAEGVQQSIRVTGATGGTFGPQGAIEFYGTGVDTPFSDKRVYWLVAGQLGGKRIGQDIGFGWNSAESASFPFTVELKERTVYFAALLSDRPDNFFGAVVSSTPVDQVLNVKNLSAASGDDARLQVVLQGVTDGMDHAVQVAVNGNVVGNMSFAGQDEDATTFSLPRGVLREGANTVTLTAQNGESDLNVVDYIRLMYPHSYAADSNQLKFTARAGQNVVVHGFNRRSVRVFDVSNAAEPVQLSSRVTTDANGFSATVRVPVHPFGMRTLLAVADDQVQKPVEMVSNAPSNWHSAMTGAEYVIITSAQFAQQVTPLADLRRAQGRSVAVVNVDDLYDEFNFGERSPNSIRDFLKTASMSWRTKPAYLLLAGDASFDSRNYLGLGDFDFVPTKMINTAELKTSSDDWFSDFTGTGNAQIATGRLPVRTQDEAQTVVSKIVGYETSTPTGGWQNQVMLVANAPDEAADFITQEKAVGALLPGSLAVTEVLTDRVSSSTARQQVIDGINEGTLLVNYNGHGSVEVWSDSLFDNTAAESLRNGSKLPVFLMMNCLNGYFHDVYTQSLAETLLLKKDGGAVAVWASSGLTSAAPQFEMDKAAVSSLFSQPSATLGDAVQKAKSSITDPDARKTFVLFGDPLLRLRRGTMN